MDVIFDKLEQNGWRRSDENTILLEKYGKVLNHYTTRNQTGTDLYLEFLDTDTIRLRIQGVGNDRMYFQMKKGDFSEIIDNVIENQNEVTPNDYFIIYQALNRTCSTSILAWEQFI